MALPADQGPKWKLHYGELQHVGRSHHCYGHAGSRDQFQLFSDSINRNSFAYPTTLTDGGGFSSVLQYNFDFGARTRAQGPPPQGQSQGRITTFTYDAAARIERVTTTNNGAYTRYIYGPNYVESWSSVNNVADEARSVQFFTGMGQVVASLRNHPGSAGGTSVQLTYYDIMGRADWQSNPTEINTSWSPSGDDAAGWLHTKQTYDWNGRPLRTTHPDLTYKEASYGGCGCAGGAVVTLTDEGTIDGITEKRRQQKIYADVLGRTVKTEILNWQGGSVYTATLNSYNVRDQVTQVRRYAGPEGSGTYQETTMSYDGHGRLKTRHLPEQNTGATTTWDYNADDTIQKITDARGTSQVVIYNGRHLVTGISPTVPSGSNIPVPTSSAFEYDAAGNRLRVTDDSGRTDYIYNELSQLTSETKQFAGLGGSYTLSYQYSLGGKLKKVTDPTNVSINYNYDTAGRTNGVTGENTLYGGVSQYASGMGYRAWGGLKGMTYGNNFTLAVSYNSRQQPTQLEVAGRAAQFGPSTVMKTQYQYYSDGSLKFADDLLDERYDRAFSYDHMRMFKEAYSGSEARDFVNGTNSGTPTGAYRQTFQNDSFGNMTSMATRFWSHDELFSASYTNNRRQGFSYDADGRLTQDSELQYYHDAAGRTRFIFSAAMSKWITLINDSDGQLAKRVETQYGSVIKTTYYLRSTALGGFIVTEMNAQGQKEKGYVFAGGQVLAEQLFGGVNWVHENPLTGSRGVSATHGSFSPLVEPDATGLNVGFSDPFESPFILPSPETAVPILLSAGGGCGGNPNCTRCYLDGFEIGCNDAFLLMEIGAAAQCPNNNCGPRQAIYNGERTWAFFHAYGDGYQGYVPSNARYVGNGGIAPRDSLGPPTLGSVGNRPDTRNDTDLGRLNGANRPEQDLGRTPQSSLLAPQEPNATVISLVNRTFSSQLCTDFFKVVLGAASTKSNPVLYGGDIQNIFSDFLAQNGGGISRARVKGAPYGTAIGRIGGNATISSYPVKPPFDQDREDASTIVNELPHIAGSKGGWPREEYDDFALAQAVHSTPYGASFSLKGNYASGKLAGQPKNPFEAFPDYRNARRNRYDTRWSNYFHNILNQNCIVPVK